MYNGDRKKKITSISRVSTIAEFFNSMPAAKKQCSEVHKLIKLYYTYIPLTSASCESTFSAMRRLKTWLRVGTDEANHLNNIMFANIQKKDLDKVDFLFPRYKNFLAYLFAGLRRPLYKYNS